MSKTTKHTTNPILSQANSLVTRKINNINFQSKYRIEKKIFKLPGKMKHLHYDYYYLSLFAFWYVTIYNHETALAA